MNRDLVHGAYTYNVELEVVTWRDTLRLESLDVCELQGSINALSLALWEHGDELLDMAYSE